MVVVGIGATFTGVARKLKEMNPSFKLSGSILFGHFSDGKEIKSYLVEKIGYDYTS